MAHAYYMYKSCSALIDRLFLAMNSVQAAIEIFTYIFLYIYKKLEKQFQVQRELKHNVKETETSCSYRFFKFMIIFSVGGAW